MKTLIIFFSAFLVGCESCEDRGQVTTFVGFMFIPQYIGSTLIMQPFPLYECRDETRK